MNFPSTLCSSCPSQGCRSCSAPGRSTGKKAAASHGERHWEVGQPLPRWFLIRRAILRLARAPGELEPLLRMVPPRSELSNLVFHSCPSALPFPSSMPPQLLGCSKTQHVSDRHRWCRVLQCHKPQSFSKPCKSQKHEPAVATLTFPVVFQELVPSFRPCLSWKDHRASVAEWHTDQRACNKSRFIAITQMEPQLSSSSPIASFGAKIAPRVREIIGIRSTIKPHVWLTIQAELRYGRHLAGE